MRKFKFLDKSKTPHQKLYSGLGIVQHRASLWCWVSRLPKSSGVYCFRNKKKKILYIGKASNIRKRVKNHFSQLTFRSSLFINKTQKIGYLKTGSEIEALILEAKLIKKYQPKYNVLWRDDKNYFFVAVTKEDFPRIFLTHQPAKIVASQKLRRASPKSIYIGPFVEGSTLKTTLRVLRKIFPYYTVKRHPKTLCLWCQLNLCPGPNPNSKEYKKNIKNLIAVLKGGKQLVLKKLQKEMKNASTLKNFEIAAKIRDQINAIERVFAHTHLSSAAQNLGGRAKIFREKKLISISLEKNWLKIQEVLQNLLEIKRKISRIEAYDISNIQGKLATGSMVTFINGQPDKNFYRKFKIKITGKPNDIAMIKEIIKRRLKHSEWGFPDLILIDGGKAQLNIVVKTKNKKQETKKIKVIALAKKKNELYLENQKPGTRAKLGAGLARDLNKVSGAGKPILLKSLPREIFNLILQLRDEAHRFAIAYHRKLREIAFGNFQRRSQGKRIGVSSRGGKTANRPLRRSEDEARRRPLETEGV